MITENTIIIHGPMDRVFGLAADVLRWPEILPHYRWVKLISEGPDSRVVEMAATRDGIPVKWTSIQRPVPHERRILFTHIKGWTKGMKVEWTLREVVLQDNPLVQVRIIHEFNPGWPPVIGPFLAKRLVGDFFVHNIAGKTLARIKELVETGKQGTDAII